MSYSRKWKNTIFVLQTQIICSRQIRLSGVCLIFLISFFSPYVLILGEGGGINIQVYSNFSFCCRNSNIQLEMEYTYLNRIILGLILWCSKIFQWKGPIITIKFNCLTTAGLTKSVFCGFDSEKTQENIRTCIRYVTCYSFHSRSY